MNRAAPGSFRPPRDRWGSFERAVKALPAGALVIVDRKVARAHRKLLPAVEERGPADVIEVDGGEGAKSLEVAQRILARAAQVPRRAPVLAVGGGTIGDLAAVVAHLHKRGTSLIHVPTTILAAVDSSLGGKGAVDIEAGDELIKNAIGVFHYADQTWLCPELFETLSDDQRREGAIEAWKMMVCLSPALWRRRKELTGTALIRQGRALKARVCARDPYEQTGLRRVLNFGHTFGHAFESASGFRVSHGDAVGMGMLCALDVGRALGVTSDAVAQQVERALLDGPVVHQRGAIKEVIARVTSGRLQALLKADKKATSADALTMVLLRRPGRATVEQVPHELWRTLARAWRTGARP